MASTLSNEVDDSGIEEVMKHIQIEPVARMKGPSTSKITPKCDPNAIY